MFFNGLNTDGVPWDISKDAGFVYESFRNESNLLRFLVLRIESTKRVFEKKIYETNPRYESLRFGVTNPDSRIRILRIRKDSDSRIFIFKDSFRAIVLRIRKDSWGFVGFVKTGRIFGSSGHETNPRFESLRFGFANPDSRICEVRIRDTIRNESFWSQDS